MCVCVWEREREREKEGAGLYRGMEGLADVIAKQHDGKQEPGARLLNYAISPSVRGRKRERGWVISLLSLPHLPSV